MTPADWRAVVAEALSPISGDPFRDGEILDELAQHCADRAVDLRAEGLPDDVIRARVLAEVSDLARQRRTLRQAVPPDGPPAPGRRGGWPAGFWQDVRYGFRLILRAPAFSVAALLTMALAIGGATMAFSVVRTVLLRPLPYHAADRLVYVWEVTPRGEPRNVVAAANYLDWRDRATSFAAMAAMTWPSDVALTGFGEPRRIRMAQVTPTIFDVFQPTLPALGRWFDAAEAVPDGPPVAILSHRFWRDQMGAAPDAIGKTVVVDARARTIVGVLPPAVDFSLPSADVFVPLRFTEATRTERRSHNYYVTARLRDGTSHAEANAEMKTIVTSLAQQFPKELTKWGVFVVGLRDDEVREARPLLLVLMGVASLLLLIAGANLASLQLVRASRRRGELAIRAAIGAGLPRLIRQVIVEAVLLCGLGGVLAVGLTVVALPIVLAAAPADVPYLSSTTIDGAALWFAIAVALVCGVLVGLAPALMLWRTDLQPLLHSTRTSSGPRQERTRHALVAMQVGLALVLIICASLLTKSMWRLSAVDFGFAADGVASAGIFLPAARYDSDQQLQFFDQVLERIRAIPGVTAAASSSGEFGVAAGMTFSFAIEGRVSANANGREDPVPLQAVTPQFFETMKIPLLQGRTFTAADRSGTAAVVMINDRLARRLFPDGRAVGQRIAFRQGEPPWREIVGVVGDTRDEGLDRDSPPMLYLPYAQRASNWRWMSWQSLLIRTETDPAAVIPAVRRAVWSIDPDLPLVNARPVVAAYAEQLSQRRFALGMLIACASLAVILGAMGIYGLLACAVADRRREIGIRRALGAGSAHVVGSIVRSTMAFAAAGAIAGIAVALAVTRFMSSLLFDVDPRDPATFVVAAAMLCGVAALAAWLPARRATGVNPIETLRES